MKKVTAVVAIVLALTLTGCGAAETDAADERTASPEATVAPLAAETPEAVEASDAETAFLAYVRDNLPTPTSIPDATDEQLLVAGAEACERMAANEPTDAMSVIDGERPWDNGYYYDSAAIITGASINLCPVG